MHKSLNRFWRESWLAGGSVTRVLREVGYAAAPELRLLIVDGRCAARNTGQHYRPLFSINALPDRVTPRWPPPSLLLSPGSDIKASPFTVVVSGTGRPPAAGSSDGDTAVRQSRTDGQTDRMFVHVFLLLNAPPADVDDAECRRARPPLVTMLLLLLLLQWCI